MQCKIPTISSRLFSTSRLSCVREIIKQENGKTITFEGVRKASPRANNLINPNLMNNFSCQESSQCHPLCRFDKVHEIKHTGIEDIARCRFIYYSSSFLQMCLFWTNLWMEEGKLSIEKLLGCAKDNTFG